MGCVTLQMEAEKIQKRIIKLNFVIKTKDLPFAQMEAAIDERNKLKKLLNKIYERAAKR